MNFHFLKQFKYFECQVKQVGLTLHYFIFGYLIWHTATSSLQSVQSYYHPSLLIQELYFHQGSNRTSRLLLPLQEHFYQHWLNHYSSKVSYKSVSTTILYLSKIIFSDLLFCAYLLDRWVRPYHHLHHVKFIFVYLQQQFCHLFVQFTMNQFIPHPYSIAYFNYYSDYFENSLIF